MMITPSPVVPGSSPFKVGLVFLGRRRPGFDPEWGHAIEMRVRGWLRNEPTVAVVEPTEKAVDEASLRRALAECTREGADCLVILQTTMGDGRLAPTVAQLWPDPVILWATPENPKGDMISSCSLVGTHCWASIMRQIRHGFEVVYGDPDEPKTRKQFLAAVQLAVTVRRLRTLRLGLIGAPAPGFPAMAVSPFEVQRALGAQLQTYSLVEFGNVVNAIPDEAVAADVAAVQAMRTPVKDTSEEDLPMASRLYLAMRSYFETESLDALAVRCWPEMPNVFGQWPYLGVARLADEGRAIAYEGDVDGAITAWLGERLGFGRCYLSDWLEHDDETITTWHLGAAPLSLCQPPGEPGAPVLARHFNIRKPLVVEATLRENMPVTIARLWRCDGRNLLTVREGESLRPKRHLMGTNGLVRLSGESPHSWFETLCHAGMPHHIAVFRGHHEALLRRFARLTHMEVV